MADETTSPIVSSSEADIIQLSKDFLLQTIAESHAKLRNELKKDITDELMKHLEDSINAKLQPVKLDIATIQEDVTNLKKTSSDAYDTSADNLTNLNALKRKVEDLEAFRNEQEKLNEDNAQQRKSMKSEIERLEDYIDDQANRGMRGNIVLRGIRETETEDEPTIDIVSKFLFDHVYLQDQSVTLLGVRSSVVRAHRSKFDPTRDESKGPRPIFIKMVRDDYADAILRLSIRNGVYKSTGVKVNQQFTPRLQKRVDEALKMRKEMFKRKEIVAGHVDYPAKLMVKFPNERKYKLVKEF